ncbi:hypothetical protein EAG_00909 [Camponotus floridanus]|uniref:Uncharacterized protein n=1 Tax=Camponotus floridanus TaxID=104421 RepID=E2A161_CAMFO|nr:hypothetical protein EAG_00909 [Camponotus floridanus]
MQALSDDTAPLIQIHFGAVYEFCFWHILHRETALYFVFKDLNFARMADRGWTQPQEGPTKKDDATRENKGGEERGGLERGSKDQRSLLSSGRLIMKPLSRCNRFYFGAHGLPLLRRSLDVKYHKIIFIKNELFAGFLAKEQIATPVFLTRNNGLQAITAQTTYSLRGVVKEGKFTRKGPKPMVETS